MACARPWRGAARLLLFVSVLAPVACAQTQAGSPVRQELAVITATGKRVAFQVEVAGSPQARRTGLMFRESLAPDHGMLFLYSPAQRVAMWMKNTLLPLDMLFIDGRGRITRIHADAEPLSGKTISSGSEVRAVLEINGGLAAFHGIGTGDRVVYAPLWPGDDP